MEIQEICESLLEKAALICNDSSSTEYEKTIRLSSLMTILERMGVPLLLKESLQWAYQYGDEEKQLMLETYQMIADMRDL